MNEREQKERFQRAVDSSLSGLRGDPDLAGRLLRSARRKEEIKVKKKLSLGVVLILILILASATALAATLLWEQYAPQVKRLERELGDYAQWPLSEKTALIQALVHMGYIQEDERTKLLLDETVPEKEREAQVDAILLALTGQKDVRELNLDVLTYALLGSSDAWTPEQRVWWNEVTGMFQDESGNPDTLIRPDGKELPEADAVAIAKAAILSAFDLPEDALDQARPVANLYMTDARPNYRRWDIQFKLYRADGSDYVERIYCAIVDMAGNVIGDPDVGVDTPQAQAVAAKTLSQKLNSPEMQLYLRCCQEAKSAPFMEWPYELKAAYSQELVSLGLDQENIDRDIAQTVLYIYGVPGKDALSHEAALTAAREALQAEYGLTEVVMGEYTRICEAFDVTDPDNPLWRFVLIHPDNWDGIRYRAVLDGKTGAPLVLEVLPWQPFSKDQNYDQKYY